MARQLNAPVAILSDIPNQPLFGGLVEDDLLAHTFVQFIATQDPTWPLLLPMVKAVVRAMDAIQAFLPRQLKPQVTGFLLSGASKRGWTTWLTPAVDDRVRGIAPLVYDNLDLARQMQHQRETWGHFSGQIAQYTERGLPQRLLSGEKAAVELAAIVDPFSYRQHLTVPKLIVLGTNDRYWPLDALNLYYDALIGERYILYMPNAGHELRSGRERALAGLMAFFQHVAGRLPIAHVALGGHRQGAYAHAQHYLRSGAPSRPGVGSHCLDTGLSRGTMGSVRGPSGAPRLCIPARQRPTRRDSHLRRGRI